MGKHLVAERLGKFVHEVDALPYEEFIRWLAYFQLQVKENKKAANRGKRK